MPPVRTINGFTRPKHPFQLFTMVFFTQILVCASVGIIPITNVVIQVTAGLIFYILATTVFVLAYIVSSIDPTDDIIINARISGQSNDMDQDIYDFFCSYCDSYVSNSTKHCRVCERCVSGFDHHCKWLNNCIGKKNYQWFFRLLICVTLYGIAFIVFAYFSFNLQSKGMLIWIWINVAIVGLLFILNSNLLFFHIWLRQKGQTTYEFIIKQRTKKQSVEVPTPKEFCCLPSRNKKVVPENVVDRESMKQIVQQGLQKQGTHLEVDAGIESDPEIPRRNSQHTINEQQQFESPTQQQLNDVHQQQQNLEN